MTENQTARPGRDATDARPRPSAARSARTAAASTISTAASRPRADHGQRVSMVASSRAGSRGSAMPPRLPGVIRSPSTPRPMTAVSSPVSMIWTMNARTRAVQAAGDDHRAACRPAARRSASGPGVFTPAGTGGGPPGWWDDPGDGHHHGGDAQGGLGVAADGRERAVEDLADARAAAAGSRPAWGPGGRCPPAGLRAVAGAGLAVPRLAIGGPSAWPVPGLAVAGLAVPAARTPAGHTPAGRTPTGRTRCRARNAGPGGAWPYPPGWLPGGNHGCGGCPCSWSPAPPAPVGGVSVMVLLTVLALAPRQDAPRWRPYSHEGPGR